MDIDGRNARRFSTRVLHAGFRRSFERRFGPAVLGSLIVFAALPTGSAAQAPSLELVLTRAGRYVTQFHSQLAGIVAEESYVQEARRVGTAKTRGYTRRELKSDLLLVRPANSDRYVEFRDVFEVDHKTVRDRQDRLTALFIKPTPETENQLKAIITESARYNPGNIYRNINTPMLVLSFLDPEMQSRFRFNVSRQRDVQRPAALAAPQSPLFRVATEMWVISFRERARPTVIRTTKGADFPAAGRLWIDPATGTVLMTELVMENRHMLGMITVSYQSEPLLGFHVPIAMQERYHGRAEYVEALAQYGRFRQFQVKTIEVIGKPPGAKK
jgi:hypothetical protein